MLSRIKTVSSSEGLAPTFLHVVFISEGILTVVCGCSPLESIK